MGKKRHKIKFIIKINNSLPQTQKISPVQNKTLNYLLTNQRNKLRKFFTSGVGGTVLQHS